MTSNIMIIKPEEHDMTTVAKFTNPGAAATEVDARARRYVSEHGVSYKEAMNVVLKSDKDLAETYAEPATRRRVSTMAVTDARSKPAIPVSADVEAEILDWITRALNANMAGSLPGPLGQLSVEADAFRKLGMPVAEAVSRAVNLFPHLRDLAGVQLRDIRRNAPGMPTGETAAAQAPGDIVHQRAKALTEKHPHMDYHAAMDAVLAEDPSLKTSYAGT